MGMAQQWKKLSCRRDDEVIPTTGEFFSGTALPAEVAGLRPAFDIAVQNGAGATSLPLVGAPV